jgi:hypothetical protein
MDVDLNEVFAAAGVPVEMLDRVDQSWSAAVVGGARELGQYVKATETVVGAVVTGLTVQGRSLATTLPPGATSDATAMSPYDSQPVRIGDVVGDVMARVVMAPLTEPAARPGRVIALHAVENVGLRFHLGIGQVLGLPDQAPPAEIDLMSLYSHGPHTRSAATRADEMLQEIARILGAGSGWSAEPVRRVLQPDNEEVLATWLATSRPTLRVWEEKGLAPGDKGKRARTVERIAELIERHIDPGDVARYVHDTPVEALGDTTLAEALSAARTEELSRFADDLRDILVW